MVYTAGYVAPEVLGYFPDNDDDDDNSSAESSDAEAKDYTVSTVDRGRRSYAYAVDIWALGIIVHELITGEVPFRSLKGLKRFATKRRKSWRRLETAAGGGDYTSRSAKDFIYRLLRPAPEERPTATECLGDIWFVPLPQLQSEIRWISDAPHDLPESPPSLVELAALALQEAPPAEKQVDDNDAHAETTPTVDLVEENGAENGEAPDSVQSDEHDNATEVENLLGEYDWESITPTMAVEIRDKMLKRLGALQSSAISMLEEVEKMKQSDAAKEEEEEDEKKEEEEEKKEEEEVATGNTSASVLSP